LKREVGGMTVFSWTWMKIQVKIAHKSATFTFIIPYTEDLDILMPRNIFSLSSCCIPLA
jgi:hypothetical protein